MPDPTITAYRELAPDDLLTALIARAYPASNGRFCLIAGRDDILCARLKGHEGPHVSHGVNGEPVAVWPQEDT